MRRGLGLRGRASIAVWLVVTVAVIAAAASSWFVTHRVVRAQLDQSLQLAARGLPGAAVNARATSTDPRAVCVGGSATPSLGDAFLVQRTKAARRCVLAGSGPVPTLPRHVRSMRPGTARLLTVSVSGRGSMRVHVSAIELDDRRVVLVGTMRSLASVEKFERRLGFVLLGVALLAMAAGLALGGVAAAIAVRPVRELRREIADVAADADVSRRVTFAVGDPDLEEVVAEFDRLLVSLDDAERERARLISDASHELRTPLVSIRTNIELLQRGAGATTAERQAMLDDAQRQVVELVDTVEGLVRLARGRERGAGTESWVSLRSVIDAAAARASTHFPDTTIIVGDGTWSPTTWGVRSDIDSAVNNLVDNACRWASSAGGVVEIDVDIDGTITVADNGPGFDESALELAFERFWRADNARGMPGSGLGLSIVRTVARAHGGEAGVGNRVGADGAACWIRLPIRERAQ